MKKLLTLGAIFMALAASSQAAEPFDADANPAPVMYRVGLGLPLFDVVCTTVPRTCTTFVNASFSGTTTFTGTISGKAGSAASPSITFGDADSGFFGSGPLILWSTDGIAEGVLAGNRMTVPNDSSIGWTPTGDATAVQDLSLARGGAPGSLRIFAGTTPTGTGCGTGATYAGNNTSGTVTIGTTPGTCIITFNGTWTNVPRCHLNNRTSAVANRATANSTTAFTIAGTIAASDVIDWDCKSS